MLKPIPTVERWMTRNPRWIDSGARLSQAHAIMREEGIRHLLVMEGRKFVGLVSLRDLHLIETLKDVDPEQVAVHEAMTAHPFSVSPRAQLVDIVNEMAEHKLGAAVVLEHRRVVGIFTTVDAMSAFAELLRSAQDPGSDHEGAERPADAVSGKTPAPSVGDESAPARAARARPEQGRRRFRPRGPAQA